MGEAATARPRFLGSTAESTRALIAGHKRFVQRYAESLERLRGGDREVIFPAGTYKLYRYYGVKREELATGSAATESANRAAS